MKKLLSLFTAIISVVFSLAFTSQAQKTIPSPTPAAPVVSDALFYKITGKDLKKPSYIFGTMHIICEADMFPMDKLTGYLGQTEQLVLEIDMDDPAQLNAVSGGYTIAGGKTFTEFLKPEEITKTNEFLRYYIGIPLEQVKMFKPIIVQSMIIASPRIIGCGGPSSYETDLLNAATERKMPVLGLETAALQFEVLDKIPLEKQTRDLYKMVTEPDKYIADFKKLLAVYKTQSSEALMKEMERQMKDDKEFQANLLDQRNKNWIPKIEQWSKEKSTFYAVGGGHLGGKTGVLELLKAKGYKIEEIKL